MIKNIKEEDLAHFLCLAGALVIAKSLCADLPNRANGLCSALLLELDTLTKEMAEYHAFSFSGMTTKEPEAPVVEKSGG